MEGPVDRCPYERPFADDFDCCPAYQPVRYVPLDLTHKPLQSVWTCGHLEPSRNADAGYYGSCRLGDAAGRLEWVRRIAADRQHSWQEIAREFGTALAEPMAALFAAKARQLELLKTGGAELEAAEADLRARADQFLALDFELLSSRKDELERIGFPTEPMRTVTTMAMKDLLTRESLTAGYNPPDEVMAAFPDETRGFLAGLFRRTVIAEPSADGRN